MGSAQGDDALLWYPYTLSEIGEAKWFFKYPFYTPSEVGDFAEMRRTYTVNSAQSYLLRLTSGDNYVGPTTGYRLKQLLVNDKPVWEQDVGGGVKGSQPIQVDVTEQVKEKSSVVVTVRVIDLKGVKNFGVDVWWGEINAEGLQPAGGPVWSTNTPGKWQCYTLEEMKKREIEEMNKREVADEAMRKRQEEAEVKQNAMLQKEAPDFTLKALDGTEVNLKSLRGKAVLIDFWSSWCAPCREALPHIQKVHNEFKEKGLVVLGVNGEPAKDAQKFIQEKGYTFTTLIDEESKVSTIYNVLGIPTTVIIDEAGILQSYNVGYEGPNRSEANLRMRLAKAGVR
jgi:peroxiredoxin